MNKFMLFLMLVLSGSGLLGQEAYSLESAKKLAVENSSSVKSAELDVQIMEKRIWETKAIGLPQVNMEGSFQNFIDIPTQVIPAQAFNPFAPADELIGVQFGTDHSVSANLTVSQLLFDGRYLIGLKAIQMLAQISNQSLKKTEKVAREEAEDAYYMVAVSAEQIKILEETEKKIKKIKEDLQTLADERVVEQSEADQMALNYTVINNNLILARKQNDLALQLLKLKMGLGMEQEIATTDSLDTFIKSIDINQYTDKKFESSNHLDVQLLETQLVLDGLNIKNEQSAGYPSLAAFFQTQQQAFRNDFDFFSNKPWYPANVWGLNLSVPIFSSGQRNAKVKQAELMKDKTELLIGSVKEGLQLQVMNAKVNLKASWDMLLVNKQRMEIAEKLLNSAQIKFKEGIISSTDFTQVENQLIQSQSDYINSAYSMLKSKLELDKLSNNE